MKKFDIENIKNDSEFMNLFKEILFCYDDMKIADLIKKFDLLYSNKLEIPTTRIRYERTDNDVSYVNVDSIEEMIISISVMLDRNRRLDLIETYIHEKRHIIQHLSVLNKDDTILEYSYPRIARSHMVSPITKRKYVDIALGKLFPNPSYLMPTEEDAYYNSNLELKKLLSVLIKNSSYKKNLTKKEIKAIKNYISDVDCTIYYYYNNSDLDEKRFIYDSYLSKIQKVCEVEKQLIEKIKNNINHNMLSIEQIIIANIVNQEEFNEEQKQILNNITNSSNIETLTKEELKNRATHIIDNLANHKC